ncbi:MAG: helix-turn-helix transcriptional regulator [Planctomycetota bacterium]
MKKPLPIDNANGPRSVLKGAKAAAPQNVSRTLVGADWRPPERFRTVSLKSVAELLDTTRSSARRWLKQAGIRPVALGCSAKGAIRYRWQDVEAWLSSREYVE